MIPTLHRMGDLRRRTVLRALASSGAVGGSTALADGWALSRHTDSPWSRTLVDPDAITAVHTAADAVALTFDDGPDPRFTPHVLDVLAGAGATATFFVVGRNAEEHSDLVRRIVAEGHEVANHTQDHVWLDGLDDAGVRREITAATASLRAAGAPRPHVFRPPRGWTSSTAARAAAALGLRTVFWTDCLEARLHHGVPAAAAQVADGAHAGSVLLLHDGGRIPGPNAQELDRSATVEALPYLLAKLHRRGLAAASLRRLLPEPLRYEG
jgi:peptidoglycan/xylan/chitin deacetylase (PgdA/CDA1 family)